MPDLRQVSGKEVIRALNRVLKKSIPGLFHLENRKTWFSVFSEFHGLTDSMKFAAPSMARNQAVFQQSVKRLGFAQVRQRGSHVVLKKQTAEGALGCVVPLHKTLAIGTLRGILKQAGVAHETFIENL